MKHGLPEFLTPPEPKFSWWNALGVILKPQRLSHWMSGSRLFRDVELSSARTPIRSFSSSGVIHVAVILLLVRLPFLLPDRTADARELHPAERQILYFDGHTLQPVRKFPNINTRGPGGKPGQGIHPLNLPRLGASLAQPKMKVVMNFPHPDNPHQTILQPNTPPELRINHDVPVPDMFTGNPLAPPKPGLKPSLAAPRMEVTRVDNSQAPDPKRQQLTAEITMTDGLVTNADPRLALPVQAQLAAPKLHARAGGASGGSASGGDASGDPSGILALSTDPSNNAQFNLPGGNRYGAFTIAPPGGQPGSPGGIRGGDPDGGTGGKRGSGGEGSSGVGRGKGGGGGGGAGGNSDLSVVGGGADAGTGGIDDRLPPGAASEALVYKVPPLPGKRKPALLVSAGPIGGGGLRAYGVLHGRMINTIYIEMTGGSWILEYCLPQDAAADSAPTPESNVIELRQALLPPTPVDKFDFHRPPVPADTRKPLVVLHGTIREDGTVDQLTVLEGPTTDSEQAAVAAFRRWKFMPALQGGKPQAIEILVGIPAKGPAVEPAAK